MKRCLEHTWTRGSMNDLFERCRWCGETRKLPSKAPSSPVETTGADPGTTEQRWDLDAPYATWDLLDLIAYIDHWRDKHAALTDEVERHDRERQGFKAAIAQRDATIERLWAQLNEATNVPERCQGCDDEHCTAKP